MTCGGHHQVKSSFAAFCLAAATLILGIEGLSCNSKLQRFSLRSKVQLTRPLTGSKVETAKAQVSAPIAPNAAADAAFATVGPQFRRAPAGQHCQEMCTLAGKKSASFPGANKALPTDSLCAANPDGTGMES